MPIDTREIHYRYCIGIMVGALVVVMALSWYRVPELAQLLSFGVGLASLALAVVAIVQSFVAGLSFQSVSERMASVAGEVSRASASIIGTAASLETRASELPPLITKLNENAQRIASTAINEVSDNGKNQSQSDKEVSSDLSHFLASFDGASISAKLVIYACISASKVYRMVDAKKLVEKLDEPAKEDLRSYFEGALTAYWLSGALPISSIPHEGMNLYRVERSPKLLELHGSLSVFLEQKLASRGVPQLQIVKTEIDALAAQALSEA